MAAPLEGILVVSIDQAVAAPFAASRLADAGARVIKVERPGGDFARRYESAARGQSAHFAWLNRGKESVEIDFSQEAGKALLHAMIARADVFIQNLAPGAAPHAGFGSGELRARYPRLITCDISGYGEDGPYGDMKAYDLLIQSETGLASITGSPDAPGRVGVSIADIAAGMYAHSAILTALLEREKSGKGQGIAVSLFDAVADWMTVPLLFEDYHGGAPGRVGLNHPMIAPYGRYATGDGKELVIAIQNEREWARFCDAILRNEALALDERFASNEARVRNRPALNALIDAVFSTRPRAALVTSLADAGIAFGAVNSVGDLSRHSQLRRMQVETPAGTIAMPAPPARMTGQGMPAGCVPALGEGNERLRAEFMPAGEGKKA